MLYVLIYYLARGPFLPRLIQFLTAAVCQLGDTDQSGLAKSRERDEEVARANEELLPLPDGDRDRTAPTNWQFAVQVLVATVTGRSSCARTNLDLLRRRDVLLILNEQRNNQQVACQTFSPPERHMAEASGQQTMPSPEREVGDDGPCAAAAAVSARTSRQQRTLVSDQSRFSGSH